MKGCHDGQFLEFLGILAYGRWLIDAAGLKEADVIMGLPAGLPSFANGSCIDFSTSAYAGWVNIEYGHSHG